MPRITVARIESLKEAAEAFTSAWEEISDEIDAWLAFQAEPPTTAEGREDRQLAREEMEAGLDAVWNAVADLAALRGNK